jgi:solute:Na+ symporter, SSS family
VSKTERYDCSQLLGAGCSILRAMTDATTALGPHSAGPPIWSRVLPIALGTIVAIHGHSLVDMIVDLNMVYITGVGPLLGLTLLNRRISDRRANATLAIGGTIDIAFYCARRTRLKAIAETNPWPHPFCPCSWLPHCYGVVQQRVKKTIESKILSTPSN